MIRRVQMSEVIGWTADLSKAWRVDRNGEHDCMRLFSRLQAWEVVDQQLIRYRPERCEHSCAPKDRTFGSLAHDAHVKKRIGLAARAFRAIVLWRNESVSQHEIVRAREFVVANYI